MAPSSDGDDRSRPSLRLAVAAQPGEAGRRQYFAAHGHRLRPRRRPDSDPGQRRSLLRSHSAAGDLQRDSARWHEVPDGRAVV